MIIYSLMFNADELEHHADTLGDVIWRSAPCGIVKDGTNIEVQWRRKLDWEKVYGFLRPQVHFLARMTYELEEEKEAAA